MCCLNQRNPGKTGTYYTCVFYLSVLILNKAVIIQVTHELQASTTAKVALPFNKAWRRDLSLSCRVVTTENYTLAQNYRHLPMWHYALKLHVWTKVANQHVINHKTISVYKNKISGWFEHSFSLEEIDSCL